MRLAESFGTGSGVGGGLPSCVVALPTSAPNDVAKGRGKSGEAAGLVKDITSQTEDFEPVVLTRDQMRLHRMVRAVRHTCKAHAAAAGSDEAAAMFTFTCRPGRSPEPRSIINAVECIKKWASRKLGHSVTRYVWVAELQSNRARSGDRGAVHYHLVVWLPASLKRAGEFKAQRNHRWKSSMVLPKPDKKGWWKLGSTERDWVRTSAASYMGKYISKGSDGDGYQFPTGLRSHGAGGFSTEQRTVKSHWMLPRWMREQCAPADRAKRAKGGGFETLSGERFASPYFVLWSGRTIAIVKITQANRQSVCDYVDERLGRWFKGAGFSMVGRRYCEPIAA